MRDRRQLTEIQQVDAGGPFRIEAQQFGQHRQHRVERTHRAVCQLDAQPVPRVETGSGIQAERCFDQRRILGDAGAQHHDIAGLQAGIVGEQPAQGVAQDLDLAVGAVTGMDLQ